MQEMTDVTDQGVLRVAEVKCALCELKQELHMARKCVNLRDRTVTSYTITSLPFVHTTRHYYRLNW